MSKVFISYCHDNEVFFNENLKEMFDLLNSENGIEYFYDRKLRAGGGLWDTIEFQIRDCNLAVLLLSESYYNSDSCNKEMKDLLERKKLEGIYLLPLVISDCQWKSDTSFSSNLLLNTDGIALSSLDDKALKTEIELIKNRLINISKDIENIKIIETSEKFNIFLEDTDVFKTSHRSKNTLLLSDIFVYPDLRKYRNDEDKDDDIDAIDLLSESKEKKYVFISGDSQSGKTSLLKNITRKLLSVCFIPLYFTSTDFFDGQYFSKKI